MKSLSKPRIFLQLFHCLVEFLIVLKNAFALFIFYVYHLCLQSKSVQFLFFFCEKRYIQINGN